MGLGPSPSSLLRALREPDRPVSPAQRQVIDFLLQDPGAVVNGTIEQIANGAGVSMPTVIRACRSFGYETFRDFMLALAQDLAVFPHHLHRSVSLDDSAADVVDKIVGGATASLAELGRQLDVATLDAVAGRLATASRIDSYSVGSTSGFMSQELQTRLFRLGLRCNAFPDPHQQLISASSLDHDGVAFVISHVGSMPFALEAARVAKSQGATVIALTQADTPLARMATMTIAVSVPQDAVMRVSTEAYLAHLLVIEILTVRVAQALGPKTVARLRRFKQVLEEHGVDSALYTDIY
jgi:DNA-binding MurR/RpiR family transcriptional regulator